MTEKKSLANSFNTNMKAKSAVFNDDQKTADL